MGFFLTIAGCIAGSAFALNLALNYFGRVSRPLLLGSTFAIVGVGAYAASAVPDMITLAWAGQVPPGNIVWPCITWSLTAASALVVGAGRGVPFLVRATPFWLLGGLAMLSAFEHPRNLVAAAVLVLGGFAYATLGAQQANTSTQRSAPKVRRGHSPAIGPYRLDMNTRDAPRLVEVTSEERAAISSGVEFKNERIYHAASATFADAPWEIVLGAVDNRVYKVSALLALENREQRNALWQRVEALVRTTLGAPSNASATVIIWDTEDGNVAMNRADSGGTHSVVLTLTSRAVATFVRIK